MHFSCYANNSYSLYSINTKLHKIKFKRPHKNLYREIHKKSGHCDGTKTAAAHTE